MQSEKQRVGNVLSASGSVVAVDRNKVTRKLGVNHPIYLGDAMVLVGAINVSATETVWHGLVTSPDGRIEKLDYAAGEISLKRGDEMGRFNLGSTVILITPENFVFDQSIKADAAVSMGNKIGRPAEQ